ncbi:MAG: phosphoribosylglycinamide formyltransferase [Verrucomicrobiales bacterium]
MEQLSSVAAVLELRETLDREGRRLVFTNGCFDLLHTGHVRYLTQARRLGDALVVALNSDASVRALKGAGRPVTNEADRAEVLSALRAVDAVLVYGEERCTNLIEAIRPHIYAKGGDYTAASLNPEEKAALDEVGAEIHILPLVPGRSTTATLARLAKSGIRNPESEIQRLRLGVLGSGRGSNFEAILKAIADGILDAEVALVISDVESARILEIARAAGIPAVFVDPGPFSTKLADAAQLEISDRLRDAGVDLVALAGFMRRLKEPVLSTFAGRILNIHPSLLPAFPGRDAWQQALNSGVAETGTTVHLVTADIDAGPILGQEKVPISAGDTVESLRQKVSQAEHRLYPRVIAAYGARLCSGGVSREWDKVVSSQRSDPQ